MKRMWFAAAALLILLSACIVSAVGVSRRTRQMEDLLSLAEDAPLGERAVHAVEDAIAYWEEQEFLLDMLQQHQEIDDIGRDLQKLAAYARNKNTEEYPALCAELKRQLRHIREMELPIPQNIL